MLTIDTCSDMHAITACDYTGDAPSNSSCTSASVGAMADSTPTTPVDRAPAGMHRAPNRKLLCKHRGWFEGTPHEPADDKQGRRRHHVGSSTNDTATQGGCDVQRPNLGTHRSNDRGGAVRAARSTRRGTRKGSRSCNECVPRFGYGGHSDDRTQRSDHAGDCSVDERP